MIPKAPGTEPPFDGLTTSASRGFGPLGASTSRRKDETGAARGRIQGSAMVVIGFARMAVQSRLFFPAVLAVVAAFRLYYCFQLPVNTGDTLRHICWGLIVNDHGYTAINQSLVHFSPGLVAVSWNHLPFNYPILSLLFDQLCVLVFPSILVMKLLLTLIELLNSFLVLKYSRSRILCALYWASPISIWWVSHEGQFEPLQNLFVLLALLLFRQKTHRDFAYMVLGMGIQVKLTAIFLLPYFVLNEGDVRRLARRCGFLALAFIPTLLTLFVANPAILVLRSAALHYNPYYFNFLDRAIFGWNPKWLILSNQLATYGLLITLMVYGFYKQNRRCWTELLPLVLYLAFVKALPNAQFWYMIPAMPFMLLVSNPKLQRALFLVLPLLDIRSMVQILFGPFGLTVGNYYQIFPSGTFTDVRSLF